MTTLLARPATVTVVALFGAALAWIALARSDVMADMDAPLTMGLGVAVFLALWSAMMLATMLPSLVPMVRAFARVEEGAGRGGGRVVMFVAGYFALWTLVGAAAYAVAALLEAAAMAIPNVASFGSGAAALVIVVAGAYQLSPVKSICLSGCRSPMGFLLAHWRDGLFGAVRMGIVHGALCVGCCWLLFAALFPVGMMNLIAMAALAGLILVEKVLPRGDLVGRIAGLAIFAYGVAVLIDPSLLV